MTFASRSYQSEERRFGRQFSIQSFPRTTCDRYSGIKMLISTSFSQCCLDSAYHFISVSSSISGRFNHGFPIQQDTIFDQYTIQSAANNVINLEVPLPSLQRALRSALQTVSASIRLTKKNDVPLLALTIITSTAPGGDVGYAGGAEAPSSTRQEAFGDSTNMPDQSFRTDYNIDLTGGSRERETIVTQDIPVRVLSPGQVEGIHQPVCREPDVHILLPSLMQLKSLSDRFTRLMVAAKSTGSSANTIGAGNGNAASGNVSTRLEMAANMHGCLRLSLRADAMSISSVWTGLSNPELDPSQVDGGEEGIRQHPSTRMKELGSADGAGEEGWATVRIDGRDWSKVMSVGRLGGRVIACK